MAILLTSLLFMFEITFLPKRTGQTVLLTGGRRWSIWLPLLLQSFKHDAILDAFRDWRINDVGFILSRVRSNKKYCLAIIRF